MKEWLNKVLKIMLSVLFTIPLVALAIDALLVYLYLLAFFACVGHGAGPPFLNYFVEGGQMPEPIAAVLGLLIILGMIGAVEFWFIEMRPSKEERKRKKARQHRAPFDYWS